MLMKFVALPSLDFASCVEFHQFYHCCHHSPDWAQPDIFFNFFCDAKISRSLVTLTFLWFSSYPSLKLVGRFQHSSGINSLNIVLPRTSGIFNALIQCRINVPQWTTPLLVYKSGLGSSWIAPCYKSIRNNTLGPL